MIKKGGEMNSRRCSKISANMRRYQKEEKKLFAKIEASQKKKNKKGEIKSK